MNNEYFELANDLHWKMIRREASNYKAVEPTTEEIQKLYPGINLDFDYGLIVAMLDYLKELNAVFIYPNQGQIFIAANDNCTYSLGELLFEAENIYEQRLHN